MMTQASIQNYGVVEIKERYVAAYREIVARMQMRQVLQLAYVTATFSISTALLNIVSPSLQQTTHTTYTPTTLLVSLVMALTVLGFVFTRWICNNDITMAVLHRFCRAFEDGPVEFEMDRNNEYKAIDTQQNNNNFLLGWHSQKFEWIEMGFVPRQISLEIFTALQVVVSSVVSFFVLTNEFNQKRLPNPWFMFISVIVGMFILGTILMVIYSEDIRNKILGAEIDKQGKLKHKGKVIFKIKRS